MSEQNERANLSKENSMLLNLNLKTNSPTSR